MSLMVWITVMNVHEIDLNLLRVFDAVLHEKGVTPAAVRLGLTQPAVSNALARLRKVFGDALFVRTPRGVDATPFARELAEPVRQALALLESALAHGPGFDPATPRRAFRFYMSDLGQIEFLPPLVERVQREAPGVRLEAVALEVDDIADALAAGALDVAIGFLPGLGAPVRRQPLFKDPYLCLMREDHPIASLTQKRFLEASHALVIYRGGHRVIEEALERAGPARLARVLERRQKITPLPPPVPIQADQVALLWHDRFAAAPGNRSLRQQVVELFAGRMSIGA